MRLITRSDFDGLVCGALLKKAGVIDHWKFVHPYDLQNGLFEATEDDCLANVPFVKGCGLWFDHHSSEYERAELEGQYKGKSGPAPSCARIIYDYYGGEEKFGCFDHLMQAVDKLDSGHIDENDILNPEGWMIIGFLMDPRTGLGRWHDFTVPNYALMENLIDACAVMDSDEVLNIPDVKERIDKYIADKELFIDMVKAHSYVKGNVLVTDMRGVDPIYVGNRFVPYTLYPEASISVWITDGKGGQGCSAHIGYSVLNKTCNVNVGALCRKYDGGGHKAVGTCQFHAEENDTKLNQMLNELFEQAN